jgi:hypothetical protein
MEYSVCARAKKEARTKDEHTISSKTEANASFRTLNTTK